LLTKDVGYLAQLWFRAIPTLFFRKFLLKYLVSDRCLFEEPIFSKNSSKNSILEIGMPLVRQNNFRKEKKFRHSKFL
jgi:hypothetical protein